MKRTTVDLWVGVFVLAGLAALLTLALKVGNATSVSAADGYRVYGNFQNIGGLKPRAPVKAAGVVVGRIEGIVFDDKVLKAKVSMRIDKHYSFSRDTFASILTSGLLGEQYVGLDGGGDDAVLKDGDEIKKTNSAIVLENIIGQFIYGRPAEGGSK